MTRPVITILDGGKGRSHGGGGGHGGVPGSDDWKQQLTRTRDGHVEGTMHNLITIIENDERLKALFWLNDSSNQVVMARPAPWQGSTRDEFVDADSSELAAWLQHPERYGMKCSDDNVLKAVIAVARRYRRHPIREYLTGVQWDGTPRVETMLIDMFGASDRTYSRQASLCFMVGAVARVLWVDPKNPSIGAKVDFMLVLEGPQGKHKSTSLSELFGTYWFVETAESPTGKDFYQVIQGCWGVEIGEMDSFGKADVTAVKVAITRRTDKFRAPYERLPNSYRRECVFVGTTNDREYLKDATGGRRFLPVRADGNVDVSRIVAERDQLWAEAVRLFLDHFPYWVLPDDAPAEQAARYIGDSWEARVEQFLAGQFRKTGDGKEIAPQRLKGTAGWRVLWTTADELLEFAIGMDPARHDKSAQGRVTSIMKRLGRDPLPGDACVEDTWVHKRLRWPEGGREWRWVRECTYSDHGAPAPNPQADRGQQAPVPNPQDDNGRDDAPDF
ncbi:VapE domain-containing protein [Xylella fastidiosa]|uniref:Virulence factor n=2 Tax=Xylella fastidiosa TaxID=2371 RepID=A0AAJ5R135_XYLFS|nr:VapE domain-containing protein [Xylella fastidiosa]WCF27737.1 virulence factor [Xylella fastidiosa subsp. fastidiosa]